MKMKAFLLLLAMMCILAATCFAENAPLNQDAVPLPHERMALGGIHVGDTMENVKSILGNPDSKDYGYSQMAEKKVATWAYGNSASIHFFENNGEYYVQIVKVDADNGFATPDGIKVGMDEKALKIVRDYIFAHLDKTDTVPPFDVYMVWKCKALQNWKYLISSTLCDGMYYELTYNGDKKEWYLDAYKKFENVVIKEGE